MLYTIDCWNGNANEVASMLRRNYFNDAVAIDDSTVKVSGSKVSGHTFELLIKQVLEGDLLDYMIH